MHERRQNNRKKGEEMGPKRVEHKEREKREGGIKEYKISLAFIPDAGD